jgi:hypothetical protein
MASWSHSKSIDRTKKEVFNMIIRAKCFEDWFKANLYEYARDIALHGADAGYPKIIYTVDTVKIFDKFASEIWEMAVEDAEDMGYKNVAAMITDFNRSDMLCGISCFKISWCGTPVKN